MPSVLDEIIANKRLEVEAAKSNIPLSALKVFCQDAGVPKDFLLALRPTPKPRIIAECKRKSPSKGIICEDYDPTSRARQYERGGASAISVLTDENFFGGSLLDLSGVVESVQCPVLRKDFIIDEYQIFQARRFGASSFLLLASLLDVYTLQYFTEVGRELGMEPLLEVHTQEELANALRTDARIIGINNRNLSSMTVNSSAATDLIKFAAKDKLQRVYVYESGVENPEQIKTAFAAGFHAFLVGETLMRADDPEKILSDWLEQF